MTNQECFLQGFINCNEKIKASAAAKSRKCHPKKQKRCQIFSSGGNRKSWLFSNWASNSLINSSVINTILLSLSLSLFQTNWRRKSRPLTLENLWWGTTFLILQQSTTSPLRMRNSAFLDPINGQHQI